MLPSSHPALMNVPHTDRPGDFQATAPTVEPLHEAGSSAQIAPAETSTPPRIIGAVVLADAFSEFIATSSRLESSYRELQGEVYGLGLELAERNTELHASHTQNERMRLALQQIVDSMPCGVIVVEREGEISMINPETGRLLGLNTIQGNPEYPATVGEIAAHGGVNLERIFAAQSGADMEQEVCIQGPAGKRWLEIRNRRLFHSSNREGKPDQTILILRDITTQKRAEEDRESGRNAMALAEVATILAHEIRNPLASLELFAELIELDVDRQDEWISNLRAGIRSLSGTVNNVLSLHSPSSSKLTPLPLAAVVTNAIQFIQPLADQSGISIDWIGSSSDLLINGNEGMLQQVLLNLFSNAIRHTPPCGRVTVSLYFDCSDEEAEMHGKYMGRAVLACSDTGPGIRHDQIGHIFEPGFSGSGDTSGLGLAVCDRIMKQHSSRISAHNLFPSGACFLLEFPALTMEMIPA